MKEQEFLAVLDSAMKVTLDGGVEVQPVMGIKSFSSKAEFTRL